MRLTRFSRGIAAERPEAPGGARPEARSLSSALLGVTEPPKSAPNKKADTTPTIEAMRTGTRGRSRPLKTRAGTVV